MALYLTARAEPAAEICQGDERWHRSRNSTSIAGKMSFPKAIMKLYAGWRRETFVGPRPALLAIDLYDLVYRGGPHAAVRDQRSLSQHLRNFRASRHRADQTAVRGGAPRRHSDLLLHPGDASQQPAAGRSLDPRARPTRRADGYAIYREFTSSPTTFSSPSSAPASSRARRCSRTCRSSACKA